MKGQQMKSIERLGIYLGFFGAIVLTANITSAVMQVPENATKPASRAADLTRACVPDTGAPISVTTSTGADADSSVLDAWETIRVVCTTDTYFLVCTSATCTATSSHNIIGAMAPEYLATDASGLYYSFIAATSAGVCRITKCS